MKQAIKVKRMTIHITIAAALLGCAIPALGQSRDPARNAVSEPARAQERIYGEESMTPAERNAYRQQMQSLSTEQERAALREAHRKEIESRAAEHGVTLPEQAVPARPGDARQGPAPSGQTQPAKHSTRDQPMDQDPMRDRAAQHDMMTDRTHGPSTPAGRSQGQGKNKSPGR